MQLLSSPFNKDNEYTDILLQEYIKSDYDVRVVVLKDEVMALLTERDPYPYNTFNREELNKHIYSYYNN